MRIRNVVFAVIILTTFTLLNSGCQKDTINDENQFSSSSLKNEKTGEKGTDFYALSNNNELILYNTGRPLREISVTSITNLQPGEKIAAIDFRPATGQLYGVSNTSRLYSIHIVTGRATAIGEPLGINLSGRRVGFDFNPTVDRIRLVTDNGQNIRLHPETGAIAATDGNINPPGASITAVAYTNNMAGASSTILYDIDANGNKLYRQNPPNNGTLELVGPLGVQASGEAGFDISPDNSLALAVLFGRGDEEGTNEDSPGNKYRFYYINLETGEATNAGKTDRQIIGLAIPTLPVAYTVNMSNTLQIINNWSIIVNKPITGLLVNELIVGIDMRPATGQLYAVGTTSHLYTINMSSGAATLVAQASFVPALNGSSFGFDFNPTVDRIRLVSNTGQNLRLHPITGSTAAIDMNLNPGMPAISAAAYTNNFAGATSTILYDLNHVLDNLNIQNPPNNGTLVPIGALNLDADAENGFDIGGTSGRAYSILTSSGNTSIYETNLSTGSVTRVIGFAAKVNGFTVGLGF